MCNLTHCAVFYFLDFKSVELRFICCSNFQDQEGPPDPQVETTETAEEAPRAKKKKKTLGSFFKATERTRPDPTYQLGPSAASELQSYLQPSPLDSEEDPGVVEGTSETLPTAQNGQNNPSGPSSPSERAVSTGGHIVTCRAVEQQRTNTLLLYLGRHFGYLYFTGVFIFQQTFYFYCLHVHALICTFYSLHF